MLRCFILVLILLLSACNEVQTYAPVYEIADIEPMISRLSAPIPTQAAVVHKLRAKAPAVVKRPEPTWQWPVNTKTKRRYVSANKGIDIKGTLGEPIYATREGKVVYCGDGLRGYGNLIIIKHNTIYLSVYAHNQRVLIKQGDSVKRGQIIAKMGNTGTNSVKLHFEIRQMGKPLNPLILKLAKTV